MSSLTRGAQGTIKPKAVNVNNFFSGRNIAPGQRANGRYGMQSVGKTAGVVRRMPPPASLPSLKAENNGQDPTTQVVPQGGSGWSKTESSDIPSSPVATSNGSATLSSVSAIVITSPPTNDLRPSWLQTEKSNEPKELSTFVAPTTSSEKKWEGNNESKSALEFYDGVPTRFLDRSTAATAKPSKTKNNRIIGSQDVRCHHPEWVHIKKKLISCDDEGFESQQDKDRVCSTEESCWTSNGPPPNASQTTQTNGGAPKIEVNNRSARKANGDENRHRTSDIRILKRTDHLLLQDISDDDEEIQMTRLDKPNVNIIKRRVGAEKNTETPAILTNGNTNKKHAVSNSAPKKENTPVVVNGNKKTSKKNKPEAISHNKKAEFVDYPTIEDSLKNDEQSVPVPQENVWAKRQEERESQEREKEKSAIPRVMQQAIEQHFPLVTEAATIKVDKESTRKSIDSEFARAAIRARKLPTSNDVRRLYPSTQSNSVNSTTTNSTIRPSTEQKKIVKEDVILDESKKLHGRSNEDQHLLTLPGRDRKDSHRSNYSHDSGRNGHSRRSGGRGGVRNKFANGIKTENKEKLTDENGERLKKNPKSGGKKKEAKTHSESSSEEARKEDTQKTAGGKKQKEQQKLKSARQENRLFIPKALRKECDDLPANGLSSGKSGKTKDEAEIDRGFNAMINEISSLVGVENETENGGSIEFADEIEVDSAGQEGYDFTFDPQFHGSSNVEKAAIQQVISAVSSDDASLKEKMIRIKDLWTVVTEGERSNVAMVKPQPQVGEVIVLDGNKDNFVHSCRGNSTSTNNGLINGGTNGQSSQSNNSLAPFSGHYSAFQPLYQNNDGRLANTATSPPTNYLSNYATKQLDRASALTQHSIWNAGHLDLAALSGTPPPSVFSNTNGAYGFFSSNNQNGTNFGAQQPNYFDRPALPPANLAVGSQRSNNMFNASNAPPNAPGNNRHPMNALGANGGGQTGFPNFFNQPPPPVQQPPHLRMAPNGGQQDNCINYYAAAAAGRIPQRPFHPSDQIVWPGVGNGNFMNGPPPPPPPQSQGWNSGQPPIGNSKYWPNQNLNRIRRPAPSQSNRQ